MASGRRGRPRAGEQAERREAVLDAALEMLAERGYAGATMGALAARAGVSKESLYTWFGDKRGLFGALVRRQAEAVDGALPDRLDPEADPRLVLRGVAEGLLRLLLGPESLAVNRAALGELPASGELAAELLAQGRRRSGPLVEEYLAGQHERGRLSVDDPAEAFGTLYGLVIQDSQIVALLGEPPLGRRARRARAERAVERFLRLYAPGSAGVG